MQMGLDRSPANARRVLAPLSWSRRPLDGDVMKTLAADGSLKLRAQPRQGRYRGVSFFVPSSAATADIAHAILNRLTYGCATTVPGITLPHGLLFINDGELELPVVNNAGVTERVSLGQHYTLFTSVDTSTSAFEAAFANVMAAMCIPCHIEGGAGAALDVDWEYTPGDPLTQVAVYALEDMAATSGDPNIKMFGILYSLHIRAKDMAFSDVVAFTPIAAMVATALDAWTVPHPLQVAAVMHAQELLSKVLDWEFSPVKYQPYWVRDGIGG